MLHIADKQFKSRLLLGSAQYPSPQCLLDAIAAAKTEIITLSLRRETFNQQSNSFLSVLCDTGCQLLPNTAGCYSAKQAITTALMARELLQTNWVKLEVIGDSYTLQPNPFELVMAAQELIKQGFIVLPYTTSDLIVCQRLVDVGCEVLMPWGAMIGSGQGITDERALCLLRERFADITLIIDAGIGKPSDASLVMELGFDAVLLNTAVAQAGDPVKMAGAFALAVQAGRQGYQAGLMVKKDMACASTPVVGCAFVEEGVA